MKKITKRIFLILAINTFHMLMGAFIFWTGLNILGLDATQSFLLLIVISMLYDIMLYFINPPDYINELDIIKKSRYIILIPFIYILYHLFNRH